MDNPVSKGTNTVAPNIAKRCWNPKTKKVAFYDIEHEEIKDMCSFEEFINNLSLYMQKIIEGEL